VIDRLRETITSGEYVMGTKLPAEPRLMEELGVGRSTLREAIRVLAHDGTLEVRQGDGTYVRSLPAEVELLAHRLRRAKVREVQEVRRSLELEIVRLAAERRSKADLKRIWGCFERRRLAFARKDIPGALDADVAFHCAVAEATGNRVLADIYRTFSLMLRETLATLWDVEDSVPSETDGLHLRLVGAIEARDALQAMNIAGSLLDWHATSLSVSETGRSYLLKR
jgi:GntR family transcriptional regulator, transcriptional repressor for pyruvate dehydrogenase complex